MSIFSNFCHVLNKLVLLFLLYIFFITCGQLYAQGVDYQQKIDDSAIEYLRASGQQAAIYFGSLSEVYPLTTNHPFLIDGKFAKARLSYLGVLYPEVFLRLDLSRDELIIVSPAFREIVLFPENVDFVELHGRHIISFRRDSLPGSPSSGYYCLLHSGKYRILEKQTTALSIEQNSRTQYYSFSTRFYVYKENVYYLIRNQRGLLNVLQPYKKEMKHFISAHHLKFRNNAQEFLVQTVREFEKLSEF